MEQLDLYDALGSKPKSITLKSAVEKDEITNEISKSFDYDFEGSVTEVLKIPTFPSDFDIGLIVGSSGSGKSTIMHEAFGKEEYIKWDNGKSIASHFSTFDEASNKFGAVGLNSIPTWLKPYKVLSNGEAFRADLARRLHDNAVIDEFTSVVNREVAVSCSMSIEKYIRNNGLKNIVFCSCHDDIIPYLKPSWIYNTDTHEFYDGVLPQRTPISIQIVGAEHKAWNLFKKYHYLSADLNTASTCYMALYNDIPIAFIALLTLPGRDVKHAWREHRVVVHPDYQGMGIGNKLSETIAQAYIEKGCRYFCKTSNPRMGEHRNRSPLWKPTSTNGKARESYLTEDGDIREATWNARYGMKPELVKKHAYRVCYSHEYIGDGTVYPYTLETQSQDIVLENQMTLFDVLAV